MFLRDVLKRWSIRTVDAAADDGGAANGCRTTPSLLEELATDAADFADLACVLRLDLRAVIETLADDRVSTPENLVTSLRGRAESEARLTRVRELCTGVSQQLAVGTLPTSVETQRHDSAATAPSETSWGGEAAGGWGRWTRTRRGARVHRSATERTPAGAAS
jgi:hypothetical protein